MGGCKRFDCPAQTIETERAAAAEDRREAAAKQAELEAQLKDALAGHERHHVETGGSRTLPALNPLPRCYPLAPATVCVRVHSRPVFDELICW